MIPNLSCGDYLGPDPYKDKSRNQDIEVKKYNSSNLIKKTVNQRRKIPQKGGNKNEEIQNLVIFYHR